MHLAMTQMGKERSREGGGQRANARADGEEREECAEVIHLRDLRAFA